MCGNDAYNLGPYAGSGQDQGMTICPLSSNLLLISVLTCLFSIRRRFDGTSNSFRRRFILVHLSF